ncbi:hypothetical protein N0A02_25435 [Paraburkholderia acidicola]|uniref:Lipoprotein n=1 Tax=Paraburkholderia acidicola TaxID=1912599 RepID=A0ABV1LVG4_9BURK
MKRVMWKPVRLAGACSSILLTLAACAPVSHSERSATPPPQQVTVGCTLDTSRGDEPCIEMARRACAGDARLRTVNSRMTIPVTQGVDQHSAPLYQYSVTYTCNGASPG